MSQYRTCPCCGAHLDSGEVCDCRKKEVATSGNDTDDDTEKTSTNILVHEEGNVND